MTISKKFVVDFTDLQTIKIVCNNCRTSVCLTPDSTNHPERCPQCPERFFGIGSNEEQAIAALRKAIAVFRGVDSKKFPSKVQLEFDMPSA